MCPYLASQLSRWSSRLKLPFLRTLGRTSAGVFISGSATVLLVFEGFYNWGVIARSAYNALSVDGMTTEKDKIMHASITRVSDFATLAPTSSFNTIKEMISNTYRDFWRGSC